MKNQVGEQLSLFGLSPTPCMRKAMPDKLIQDLLEITTPPKEIERWQQHNHR